MRCGPSNDLLRSQSGRPPKCLPFSPCKSTEAASRRTTSRNTNQPEPSPRLRLGASDRGLAQHHFLRLRGGVPATLLTSHMVSSKNQRFSASVSSCVKWESSRASRDGSSSAGTQKALECTPRAAPVQGSHHPGGTPVGGEPEPRRFLCPWTPPCMHFEKIRAKESS